MFSNRDVVCLQLVIRNCQMTIDFVVAFGIVYINRLFLFRGFLNRNHIKNKFIRIVLESDSREG